MYVLASSYVPFNATHTTYMDCNSDIRKTKRVRNSCHLPGDNKEKRLINIDTLEITRCSVHRHVHLLLTSAKVTSLICLLFQEEGSTSTTLKVSLYCLLRNLLALHPSFPMLLVNIFGRHFELLHKSRY